MKGSLEFVKTLYDQGVKLYAGDTFLSGLGVFLAAGASLQQAAEAATLCSAVTVQKLHTTGTATAQEITALL